MRKPTFYMLILMILVILPSCQGVKDIRFKGVDDFVLKGMENNKVTFTASVSIFNPSSVAFKVSEVNLKTSLDGIFIGTLSSPDLLKIPARTDSAYQMDFSLELANLLTGASALYGISRKKQVNVEMKGYVKARSWLKVKKVEVNENRMIDVPSLSR